MRDNEILSLLNTLTAPNIGFKHSVDALSADQKELSMQGMVKVFYKVLN